MNGILSEVENERLRQDQKWGGSAHDDTNTPLDWYEILSDYNGWARRMATMQDINNARRRYVQIAAVAVAAVEALDREYS